MKSEQYDEPDKHRTVPIHAPPDGSGRGNDVRLGVQLKPDEILMHIITAISTIVSRNNGCASRDRPELDPKRMRRGWSLGYG
jgi:hypothetical protein